MSDTKDTTRPMTAKEYYDAIEVFEFERPDIVIKPKYIFEFARAYADYRLRFEQEKKPQPLDPFEGAPEWAEWRAADKNGKEYWYQYKPFTPICFDNTYVFTPDGGYSLICPDRRLTYSDWKQSPVKRKR